MKKNISSILYNNFFIVILLIFLLSTMILSLKHGYKNFNNNFYKKNFLIQSYVHFGYTIGNKLLLRNVLIGKEEWLLFVNDKNLDDYQNTIPLSEKQLLSLDKQMEVVNQFGKKKNIYFLIVIAPNKETIYPDKVPDVIPVLDNESRFQQILNQLKPYSNLVIIDTRESLKNARQINKTYYKTDSHWNDYGAYIVYTEIVKQLSKNYSELQIYPQELLVSKEVTGAFDLANSVGATYLLENTAFLQPPSNTFESNANSSKFGYHETTKNLSINTPSALIYHDSFGVKGLNSFLSLSFETAHFVRYEEDNYFPPNAMERFQPEIVIIEVVERHIHYLGEILDLVISP